MAYIVMACAVMACTVMAYTLMAYTVMAYTVMAYTVMADIVMAGGYLGWPKLHKTLHPSRARSRTIARPAHRRVRSMCGTCETCHNGMGHTCICVEPVEYVTELAVERSMGGSHRGFDGWSIQEGIR